MKSKQNIGRKVEQTIGNAPVRLNITEVPERGEPLRVMLDEARLLYLENGHLIDGILRSVSTDDENGLIEGEFMFVDRVLISYGINTPEGKTIREVFPPIGGKRMVISYLDDELRIGLKHERTKDWWHR